MDAPGLRVLLIDTDAARREMVARRLRAQGYAVEDAADAANGADLALRAPPAAVVADLWMPSISGVQLCRLLRSEPATADVPVILCGERDDPRNKFWAERAGAAAYVMKGRTAELVSALARTVAVKEEDDGFFVQLSGGSVDIRDRLARHLDAALFESVIAAELRSLASADNFEKLFDRLAQFMSQVTRYRWIALSTPTPERLAIHHQPALRAVAEAEARAAMQLQGSTAVSFIEDEDPLPDPTGPAPIVCNVLFGHVQVARFACATVSATEIDTKSLVAIVGRELGGAVKIALLMEESQRLAATDSLTGLMNRRAFANVMDGELSRCERHGYPLSLLVLDVDHFKQINDRRGHAAGDRALAAAGELLRRHMRRSDVTARWGGEEFVVACTSTDADGSRIAAERLREAIQKLAVHDDAGEAIPLTVSVGAATLRAGETLESLVDRADRAMYVSKVSGRNRTTVFGLGDGPTEILSDVAAVA
jgi:two-component system cell cycle response regulator